MSNRQMGSAHLSPAPRRSKGLRPSAAGGRWAKTPLAHGKDNIRTCTALTRYFCHNPLQ
jgi:hypothetical protein